MAKFFAFSPRFARFLPAGRLLSTGAVMLSLLVVFSLAVPWCVPFGRDEVDYAHIEAPPGEGHLLGTDELGRDILVRLAYGGRVSLAVGLLAMLIQLAP